MCDLGDLGTTQTLVSVPSVFRAKTQPLADLLNPPLVLPYASFAPPVLGLPPEAARTLSEHFLCLHRRCPHLPSVHALQEPSPPGSL